MTEVYFNNGETDFPISRLRIIHVDDGLWRIEIHAERRATETLWLREVKE